VKADAPAGITADGHRLGTVNVLDDKPRSITQDDTATLADLAAIVMDELELRLSALHAVRHEQELADGSAWRFHDGSLRGFGA
jgi:GAF domain-containing protein